ncbi:MAG: hypothetical protein JWR09_3733 [Mucilaginibacter sp.]|nr:hypothetical protein [Mucilaginibacter sp.]
MKMATFTPNLHQLRAAVAFDEAKRKFMCPRRQCVPAFHFYAERGGTL